MCVMDDSIAPAATTKSAQSNFSHGLQELRTANGFDILTLM